MRALSPSLLPRRLSLDDRSRPLSARAAVDPENKNPGERDTLARDGGVDPEVPEAAMYSQAIGTYTEPSTSRPLLSTAVSARPSGPRRGTGHGVSSETGFG